MNSTHFLPHSIYRANNYKNRINESKPSPGDQEIIMAACTNQKFIFQMRVILPYPSFLEGDTVPTSGQS